jgi:uncharacterized MAPEG superfamily protein
MAMEYQMLTLMTFLFLFAWLPSSLAKWKGYGGKWLASNRHKIPDSELPLWGGRVERAYTNLKDYFPAYIIAILLLGTLNKFDGGTAKASVIYVIARSFHFLFYGIGNVRLRFLSFVTAMISNIYLLAKIMM